MIKSIRWVKMFEHDSENWVDLEHILPVNGHLYIVGVQWAYVNPSWVQAFPFTKAQGWVTNDPHQLQVAKESREEWFRQRISGEPVERNKDESPRPKNRSYMRRKLRGFHYGGHDAFSAQQL